MPCGLPFRRRPVAEVDDPVRAVLKALTAGAERNTAELEAKYERRRKRYEQEDLEEEREERRREERDREQRRRWERERERENQRRDTERLRRDGREETGRRGEASGRQRVPQAVAGAIEVRIGRGDIIHTNGRGSRVVRDRESRTGNGDRSRQWSGTHV
ncbi:MAG: hypothetical protein Q9209_005196 [Squamulea sp. 1 TL-2023]